MEYKLNYLDEVATDIEEISIWYKSKQQQLAIDFRLELSVIFKRILGMPFLYPIRYKNVRIAGMRIFPYHIHYYVDEASKQIIIISIIHNKRNV